MTPRSSVRAEARANFQELALQHAPDPSRGGEETDLMVRVRGLYEDSAVPVREIAAAPA